VKKAFSMIELVFVIVIIGILAAVALPKLWVTRDDAAITKLRTDVSAVRSAISSKYGKNVMEGKDECPSLESSTTDDTVFEGVLTYPIKINTGSVKWDGNGTDYNATVGNKVVKFEYNTSTASNCKFSCTQNCDLIGE